MCTVHSMRHCVGYSVWQCVCGFVVLCVRGGGMCVCVCVCVCLCCVGHRSICCSQIKCHLLHSSVFLLTYSSLLSTSSSFLLPQLHIAGFDVACMWDNGAGHPTPPTAADPTVGWECGNCGQDGGVRTSDHFLLSAVDERKCGGRCMGAVWRGDIDIIY